MELLLKRLPPARSIQNRGRQPVLERGGTPRAEEFHEESVRAFLPLANDPGPAEDGDRDPDGGSLVRDGFKVIGGHVQGQTVEPGEAFRGAGEPLLQIIEGDPGLAHGPGSDAVLGEVGEEENLPRSVLGLGGGPEEGERKRRVRGSAHEGRG